MEREYTIGGALVLITIFVMILVIYFTVPGFNEAVKEIADDVFGKFPKLEKQLEEERGRRDAINTFESIAKCIDSLKGKDKLCTCYLEEKDLPKGYAIRTYQKQEKGHWFLELQEGNLRVKDTEEKSLEGLNFCILNKDLKPEQLGYPFIITSEDRKLRINTEEFLDNTPEFYNLIEEDKQQICFVTKKAEKAANKIREKNDCKEPEKNVAKENMLKFFNKFIRSYERCKAQKDKSNCLCGPVDFTELLDGYEIRVQQDVQKKETTFSLYYTKNERPELVDKESGVKKIPNNVFGFDYKDLPQGEIGYLRSWQSDTERPLLSWPLLKTYTSFIYKGEKKRVYLVSKTKKPGMLDKCAPEYIVGEGCEIITDKEIDEMIKRLKGENPQYLCRGKPCKEVIEKLIEDPYMRLLVAAIIPVESGFDENAINKNMRDGKVISIDKGLMQFTDGTAPGYGVCNTEGCGKGDYRNDPDIAVPAAAQLLKDNLKEFEGKTYQEVFAIAAYNAGAGKIKGAIKKTGKKDPTWNDIRTKVPEVTKCYPYKVETYKKAFEPEFIKTTA